jgi:transposase
MPKKEMTLEAVNARLKQAKIGVSVRQIGNALYLRATLPPKPNSGKVKPTQSTISTLNETQSEELQQLLRDYYPHEVGIESALWTRRAVQTLIQQQYQMTMPLRTIGDYLQCWGFSPQKPSMRFYKQDTEAVATWLLEEYPEIEQLAKREGAEIQWGDQVGLRTDDHRGRGYAPIGETPILKLIVIAVFHGRRNPKAWQTRT